ncbi:transglutaminase family protein [Loktanella sp. SALINAS62]|uniref:transglutaminase-like domain-containing protein n=1 Tax=Loktanella sp. SALINAS62 TaxID=2706124 RepID=UPI001B8AD1EC|nr:transglutaminase family protein [Loktanella sp. SALINAS62]MBS1302301.1 transglutaminase family protein [Loktanella sp. SALINAS62]
MDCDIRVHLDYEVPDRVTLLLQLRAVTDPFQHVTDETLLVPDGCHWRATSGEEGIGERIWMDIDEPLKLSYHAHVSIDRPAHDLARLQATPLFQMNAPDIKYLMASRYCGATGYEDLLDTFSHLSGGAKVVAMRDWITSNLVYDNSVSTANTTAQDTFADRRGVCRDYAHLLIALCRCSAIPARIAAVYSPDISPPDFHAVAEVFLDGGWHLVDPTEMTTTDRMVLTGVGRDAADVSFLTSFGVVQLKEQAVHVQES